VAGCILLFSDEQEDFFKVKFPDGRIGYVKKTEAESLVEWIDSRNPTEGNLVKTARQFMGIPYLWGGTSPKAVDCSGYTKTVYFMNGIILPRDASQQDDIGMLVDDQKYFSRLLPGDLLFFGSAPTDSTEEKVVHVGMWIGNMKFIHSSGDVHISSMDFNASDFDEYNYNRYLKSKRILNSQYLDELFIRKYY
jgi:cell wall-associated NlpC family hydrolase